MEQAKTQITDEEAGAATVSPAVDAATAAASGQDTRSVATDIGAEAPPTPEAGPDSQAEQSATNAQEERLEDLLSENERLKTEVQQGQERALRAGAELDNMRKRAARDVENAHKYALERFVNELLPALDSMELGLSASQAATDLESLREGMRLTHDKLCACLDKFGLKAIDPVAEKFDPEWHEAVSMQEQQDVTSGQVVSVMQKGYALNGRLLRPAMVVVAK